MAIDLDALHARITGMYWDNEPAPPGPLRTIIQARGRRLGKAPSPTNALLPPTCYDPYIMAFYYARQFIGIPSDIFQTAFTTTGASRSRHYLGPITGPARLQTLLYHCTSSGAYSLRVNVEIARSPQPDFDNDPDTDPPPVWWAIQGLALHRGIPGAAFASAYARTMVPLFTFIPDGSWHLHAWVASNASRVIRTVTVFTNPIICGLYDPELPEVPLEGATEYDPGDPVIWVGSAGPRQDFRAWIGFPAQEYPWHLALAYGGGPTGPLARFTRELPQDLLVPRKPARPPTVTYEQVSSPLSEWVPLAEARG